MGARYKQWVKQISQKKTKLIEFRINQEDGKDVKQKHSIIKIQKKTHAVHRIDMKGVSYLDGVRVLF